LATLHFDSVVKKVCLDHLYPPSAMRNGELLNIRAAMFPFGFQVLSISSADPVPAAGVK
jgi:hypothetical protein